MNLSFLVLLHGLLMDFNILAGLTLLNYLMIQALLTKWIANSSD